jgi:hypothetical protein
MTVAGVIAAALGHWLGHLLGTDSGPWYAFWSGVGADLGGLAIVGTSIGLYRRHKCHVHGCWRLAKQQVADTSWVVCHHHHPHGKPTAAQLDALRDDG